MKLFLSALLLSITFQNFAIAQDAASTPSQETALPTEFETVVKETKFNSSSRVIIDKEEIQKSRAKNITTLLATQANISIVQSNFTPTTIFMRGGDTGHILILVDGVPFYDASTIQRTINLNSLDIKSIQRIEVIKGSQSVLYGGQALSGVIKIDTIPKEIKTSGQVLVQGGNFKQGFVEAGALKSIDDTFGVSARGSYSTKEAMSPVLNSDKKYPTRIGTAEVAAIHHGTVEAILKMQTSFDRTFISTTANPSFLAADADDFVTSTYQVTGTGILSAKKAVLKPLLSVSSQKSARQFEQDFVASAGSPTKQDYIGQLTVVRLETTPVESEHFNFKVGGSFNHEIMIFRDLDIERSNVQDEFEGLFIKAEIPINQNWQIEVGERVDFRRMKSAIATYQVGLTIYELFKLEYATGFKHPSLFQLYSTYGNANLKPERSASYSASFERNITQQIFVSLAAFESRFENLILTRGFPPVYENVSNSKTRGVEFYGSFRSEAMGLTTTLGIGYQEPKDLDQNTWLVRRPLQTISYREVKEFGKATYGLEVVHTGERRDRFGAASFGTLPPHTLLNLTGEYKPNNQLSIFSRVQNLSNVRYQSNYGFYDEGLNVIAGAEVSF